MHEVALRREKYVDENGMKYEFTEQELREKYSDWLSNFSFNKEGLKEGYQVREEGK